MKKDLTYFTIGSSFGGDQRWFRNPLMRIGGCAAATACDSLISLDLLPEFRTISSKKAYRRFASQVRPYLYPRRTGVNTLQLYLEGFSKCLSNLNCCQLIMESFSGEEKEQDAKSIIIRQIDRQIPIPYLLLKHKASQLKYLTWHWFMIVGYEETPRDFYINIATYGKAHRVPLSLLWNTGYDEKGGMILYTVTNLAK